MLVLALVTAFGRLPEDWQGGIRSIYPVVVLVVVALLAFGTAAVAMLYGFVMRGTATESGFFWAILIALIGVWPSGSEVTSSGCLATAGLTLVLWLVEASYGMAFRDVLTGLPGRRALQEALIQLTGTYTVAMVDIDPFKKFNDRYGHDVGDQVLKMVAARLGRIRGGGKAFRYGGEEFAILFAGKDVEDAVEQLDSVRKDIGTLDFVIRAPGRPRKRPDKALYKAKQQGRNKVCT